MNLKLEEIARELNGFVTGRIRPGQLRRRLNGHFGDDQSTLLLWLGAQSPSMERSQIMRNG